MNAQSSAPSEVKFSEGAHSLKSKYQHCSSSGLTGSQTTLSRGYVLNSVVTKDLKNRADDKTKYIPYDGREPAGIEPIITLKQQFNMRLV